jgi:ABC-type nitrate/sulfonate/bicarbonate transport system ATPase subunit
VSKLSHRVPEPVVEREYAPPGTLETWEQDGSNGRHLPLLEARAVAKIFEGAHGTVEALWNVSIVAAAGEFVAIIGPSGCGKSTLLEILAGLGAPTSGTVLIDGVETVGRVGAVGHMPQKDLLLPWRSVLDNTILGLEVAGTPRKRARQEAMGWFPRFGLEGFEEHYPATLSGGMRQRASLLRTFLSGRNILVLDEPFGALDALTRAQMQEWLLGIQDEFHKTIVLVTHDVDEALYLSDRVYLMTARPGSISGILDVPLDRPRRYEQIVTSPEFMKLKRSVLEGLKQRSARGRT